MMEDLFWKMLTYLQEQYPGLGPSGRYINLQSFLPAFAVAEEGSHYDSSRMNALCAGLCAGECSHGPKRDYSKNIKIIVEGGELRGCRGM